MRSDVNNQQVLDIIRAEYRILGMPWPKRNTKEELALVRVAMRLVSECELEKRQAARLASVVGAKITRGRTRL